MDLFPKIGGCSFWRAFPIPEKNLFPVVGVSSDSRVFSTKLALVELPDF